MPFIDYSFISSPVETTSKKAVSRFRTIFDDPTPKTIDPRFSDLSGKYNEGLFNNSYKFLDDYEKSEMDTLRTAIKKEKSAERRAEMERELQKRMSKKIQKEREEKVKNVKRDWKKKEQEAVKDGKKPFFLKKSKVSQYLNHSYLQSNSQKSIHRASCYIYHLLCSSFSLLSFRRCQEAYPCRPIQKDVSQPSRKGSRKTQKEEFSKREAIHAIREEIWLEGPKLSSLWLRLVKGVVWLK
jgi:ribosomal RNA-processing protein 36